MPLWRDFSNAPELLHGPPIIAHFIAFYFFLFFFAVKKINMLTILTSNIIALILSE